MLQPKTDSQLSAQIAAVIAGFDPADLPASTAHTMRRVLLDALGVMLAATGLSSEARPFHSYAAATATGRSRLLGGGRSGAEMAAFANGALAHALDFGDTFDANPGHPHAALVPALIALDADPTIDGARVLTALALGGDLACRLANACARPLDEGGWYPPPLFATIGAAAGAAKLIDLEADGIVQAMGLALLGATFPGEIKYDATTQIRGTREAFGARAATAAALLAAQGVRSFGQPLEGKGGFFALYAGGVDAGRLLAGLGHTFLGEGVSFKPWPACRGTHPYIEGALALRDQVAIDRIASIEVETGPIQQMLVEPAEAKRRPENATAAKFSIPYTVAHALVHGNVTLDSFGAEARADPAVLALAAKVVGRQNPAWGREQASAGGVTIVTTSGDLLHFAVAQAAGHPSRPASDATLVAKFIACIERAAVPVDGSRLADGILSLKAGDSLAALLDATIAG